MNLRLLPPSRNYRRILLVRRNLGHESMTHKRTVGEQVRSGFLIAGELVGGFLVFVLAALGLQRLISAAPTSHFVGPVTAWIEIGLAVVIMFATAERWGGFIPGFFFLRGAFLGAFYTIFPSAASSSNRIPRSEAALLAAYSIAIIAVLWRFIPPRRARATILDRSSLTIFALSVAMMTALPTPTAYRVVLVGSAPLLFAWVAHEWKIRRHHNRHRHAHLSAPGSLNGNPLETPGEQG
jgi:hypothetical protein